MISIEEKDQDLIGTNYFPPVKSDSNWSFRDYIGHDDIRYYSFARYALYEALKLCDMKSGDEILLPGFICREVLAAINTIGATPRYYKITKDLQIQLSNNLPKAKVMIVVNYFGFSSNLDLIKEYCLKNNIIIIEDNSHGFLSRDINNKPLGTRTNIGIFSLRKSLPVVDGAALVVNDPQLKLKITRQIDTNYSIRSIVNQYIKRIIKKFIPKKRYKLIYLLITIKQTVRYYLRGNFVINSSSQSEYYLPDVANPHIDLFRYMKTIFFTEEIKRRRLLYEFLLDYIGDDVELIVKKLNPNITPYVFPFRCKNIKKIRIKLKKISLNCYKWPELPDDIYSSCPEYYKNVWMVPFLW